MNRIMAVLTVALLWPCPAAPAQGPKQLDQGPKQLDSTVVAAWQIAGAEVGWYGRTKNGEGYTTGKPDDDKALPAITLWWKFPARGNLGGNSLNPGCSVGHPLSPRGPGSHPQIIFLLPVDLSRLPAPTVPFALFLDSNMVMDSLTDAGMRDIARFKTLQYLSISSTLNLGGMQISDAGLKPLAKLQDLRYLMLGGQTKVTDAGMKDLARLKNLQILGLTSTGVTDAGLKELAGLKNLETLYLGSTRVTDASVTALKKALPKCKVYR
jgi:hypothetical protein